MSLGVATVSTALPAQASLAAFSRSAAGHSTDAVMRSVVPMWIAASKRAIGQLADNRFEAWQNFAPPTPEAISSALSLVEDELVPSVFVTELPWIPPHVSLSEEGEITFEWWNRDQKLTLYVSDQSTVYIRVWGPNIHEEMEDGVLNDNFAALWKWLMGT